MLLLGKKVTVMFSSCTFCSGMAGYASHHCHGPEGADSHGCPYPGPWGSPHLPMAQDPISACQGCQPLPQKHHIRDHLQLPTAVPWWSVGPTKLCPSRGHRPVLREVADAQGWGCPGAPSLPCPWLGWWDGPWLPGGAPGASSPSGTRELPMQLPDRSKQIHWRTIIYLHFNEQKGSHLVRLSWNIPCYQFPLCSRPLSSVGSVYWRHVNGASRQHFCPGGGAEGAEFIYSCHGRNTVFKTEGTGEQNSVFTKKEELVSRTCSEYLFLTRGALLSLSYPQGYPTHLDLCFSRSTDGHQMFSYSRQAASLLCFCPELPYFAGKIYQFSHLFNVFPKGQHKHIMFLCVGRSFQVLFAESPEKR